MRSDGTLSTVKPSHLCAARITVVRGSILFYFFIYFTFSSILLFHLSFTFSSILLFHLFYFFIYTPFFGLKSL